MPYSERRDSTVLYQQPYYTAERAIAPAGAINSSVEDLSHWLIALHERRAISRRAGDPEDGDPREPAAVDRDAEQRRWRRSAGAELLNSAYGMGRWTASYRGHLLAYHGGDLPGFHSQVSTMPNDSIGVIVLVDRRPRAAALQRAHVRDLRAAARHEPHAVDRAPERHPAEEQGRRHPGARDGERGPRAEHASLASPRRLPRRVRASRVRRAHHRARRHGPRASTCTASSCRCRTSTTTASTRPTTSSTASGR